MPFIVLLGGGRYDNECPNETVQRTADKSSPGLCCLFKYECASLYKQLLRNGKCTWGSGIDMTHSVFIGYCDIFLTEDPGFMDIVRLFNRSNLECLLLDEFVSRYGTN